MKKRDEILEFFNEEDLFDEKFDSALIGYVDRAGGSNYILYDEKKLFELFNLEPLHQKENHLYLTKANFDEINALNNDLLIADGFNDAIIGHAKVFEGGTIVIYDTEKCIKILSDQNKEELSKEIPPKTAEEIDMESYEMAVDYFYYNTVSAYVGKKTPGFATLIEEDSE